MKQRLLLLLFLTAVATATATLKTAYANGEAVLTKESFKPRHHRCPNKGTGALLCYRSGTRNTIPGGRRPKWQTMGGKRLHYREIYQSILGASARGATR